MKFNNNYFYKYKDMFNNYNLIKTINPNYELYYNAKDKKFVIVNTAKNFQICLIFDNFLQNIQNSLNFSKIENCKNIFQEIENNNNYLKNKQIENSKLQLKNTLNEFAYLKNRTSKISASNINKIIGE